MNVKRGDVVLARVPHTAGTRGKKRPAVVVQSDTYNATLRHVIVAEVTSNPRWTADPACRWNKTPDVKPTAPDDPGYEDTCSAILSWLEKNGDITKLTVRK